MRLMNLIISISFIVCSFHLIFIIFILCLFHCYCCFHFQHSYYHQFLLLLSFSSFLISSFLFFGFIITLLSICIFLCYISFCVLLSDLLCNLLIFYFELLRFNWKCAFCRSETLVEISRGDTFGGGLPMQFAFALETHTR